MTTEISRDQIVANLATPDYPRFLFYLMGPYKSFNLNYYLSDEQRSQIDVEDLPGPIRKLFQNEDEIDEAQALLRRVQGELRADPGVNAFLAIDIGISVSDVDAMTQSIEFSRCSNASAFILPYIGHNFGVGEEAGAVLEALASDDSDRLVFAHEDDVSSQMLRAANRRWDIRLEPYEDETELVSTLRQFAGEIMHRERRGELENLE